MRRVAGILPAVAALCWCGESLAGDTGAAPGSLSLLLQVFLGLAIVMAAIAFAAWLARRYLPGARHGSGPVRVIGGAMIGPKERVVIVEVADVWIVVGVTPASVTALHTLPRQGDFPAEPTGQGTHTVESLVTRWVSGRTRGH